MKFLKNKTVIAGLVVIILSGLSFLIYQMVGNDAIAKKWELVEIGFFSSGDADIDWDADELTEKDMKEVADLLSEPDSKRTLECKVSGSRMTEFYDFSENNFSSKSMSSFEKVGNNYFLTYMNSEYTFEEGTEFEEGTKEYSDDEVYYDEESGSSYETFMETEEGTVLYNPDVMEVKGNKLVQTSPTPSQKEQEKESSTRYILSEDGETLYFCYSYNLEEEYSLIYLFKYKVAK